MHDSEGDDLDTAGHRMEEHKRAANHQFIDNKFWPGSRVERKRSNDTECLYEIQIAER